MRTPPPPPDFVFRGATALHRSLFRRTQGRLGGRLLGMPVLELTTTGRKTGQERATMLTTPLHDDGRVVLVASKGGADGHPSWYLNLREHPEVTVTMDGQAHRMVARTADADEKAELWRDIVTAYRGYRAYQDRTERDIPVVILTPAEE